MYRPGPGAPAAAWALALPQHHHQGGLAADFLRLSPPGEGQEHICAHQEKQLVFGIGLAQQGHGIGRVAPALPQKLQVRSLRLANRLGRQTHQLQALPCRRGPLRHGLVGRTAVRNEQKLVQIQKLHCLPRRLHVSSMGRVKRPAVDANSAHDLTSRFSVTAFPAVPLPFPSPAQWPGRWPSGGSKRCAAPARPEPPCGGPGSLAHGIGLGHGDGGQLRPAHLISLPFQPLRLPV